MKKYKLAAGFTIVELIVVIVVIGILASITIASYNAMQDRSKATAVANDLQIVDKAFKAAFSDEQRTTWPEDDSGDPYSFSGDPWNPLIVDIANSSNSKLGDYFDNFSETTIDNVAEMSGKPKIAYDNDGDTYNGCSTGSGGVNMYFYNFPVSLAQSIDDAIDDGALNCGKVTHSGANMRYSLSDVQTIE